MATEPGYDQRNLMLTHTLSYNGDNPQLQAEYLYDGDGNRVQQTDFTGATPVMMSYINDVAGLAQVLVMTDGETQTTNLFGLGPSAGSGQALIGQDDGRGFHTLLADSLGSVRSEIVAGEVMATTTYDPFGNLLDERGHSSTAYGYTGEQWDDATGPLYLRARYYNPALRLFMSKDPWPGDSRRPQMMNGWSYVDNNPLNRVDPTGRQAECPDGVCGPDATNWLMGEMGSHYQYGIKVRNMRTRMAIASRLIPPGIPGVPLLSLAWETPFKEITRRFGPTWSPIGLIPVNAVSAAGIIEDMGWLEFATYGLAIDYSTVYYNSSGTSCGTEGCDKFNVNNNSWRSLVTLCGYCIDSSDIGNMMFGLGGAARGYNIASTYSAAGLFNGLDDWLPNRNSQDLADLITAILSPDGRGAIPGYLLGYSQAFKNPSLFCSIINGSRSIGYNDGQSGTQVSQCAACATDFVDTVKRKNGATIDNNPSSIERLSDRADMIWDLERLLHIPH